MAIHSDEHIADELPERGIAATAFAGVMGVDPGRVRCLVNAQVSVTADTALRLADAFGTSAEFWMRLHGDSDLAPAGAARIA